MTGDVPTNCSRCHKPIKDFKPADPETGVTMGYYDVRGDSDWAIFAKPGERFICDDCMHRHPLYAARHGPAPA